MTSKIKKLSKGDVVAIVNVAAPEPIEFPERMEAGLRKLKTFGLEIVEAKHLGTKKGIFSSEPQLVAQEINDMWERIDVNAIFCAGGGVAANALLRFLDYDIIRSNPKIFMGASNPTALLNAISAKSNVTTFHGPSIVWDFGDDEQPSFTLSCFEKALFDGSTVLGEVPEFLIKGSMKGRSFGGNLTTLLGLAGTDSFPPMQGAILFWEEIGVPADRIFSKMIHLEEMGILAELKGMVVGELVNCKDVPGLTVQNAILSVCGKYEFPIGWGLPFGHTPRKIILPIGGNVTVSESGEIQIDERIVV